MACMVDLLLIAFHVAWFYSETSSATEQFVPTFDSNGTHICPGNASMVFSQSRLEKPNGFMECVPSRVLCAWKCSKTENCTRFNWKETEGLCELFTYIPIQCVNVPGCVHYQVAVDFKNRRPLCGEVSCSDSGTACTWTEYPLAQIKQGTAITPVTSADECKCLCLADPTCLSCTFSPGKRICRKHDSTTPVESSGGLYHFEFQCP